MVAISEIIENQCNLIGRKAGINGKIIYFGLLAVMFFVFIGYFEEYITMTVGVLLPAHFSFKAIASPGGNDDKEWLTYWVVFSLFVIAEMFFGKILSYIPLYFFFKMGFLIWLFLPIFKGAAVLYDNFISNFFKTYEKKIEKAINNIVESNQKNDNQKNQ